MWLTKNLPMYLRFVLFAVLFPGIAGAVIEPRIIGGFAEEDPEIRGFMAFLLINKSDAKNATVTFTLSGSEHSGKRLSGAQSDAFSGRLVGCGLAETPCYEASGNICLIQPGSNTLQDKIKNCQAGEGKAAIVLNDQPNDEQELPKMNSLHIPAISVSEREGIDYFNAMGKQANGKGLTSRDSFACGGTLIETDWVLTAAHCVSDADSIKVFFGGKDVPRNAKDFIPVKRIVPHQGFDKTTMQNDIALLQLETPVNNKPLGRVDSASLGSAISSGETAYAFGRGKQGQIKPGEEADSSNNSTDKLFVVGLPLISNEVCNDRLNAVYNDVFGGSGPAESVIGSGQLCAGGIPEGGKGACFGDSGGPLAVVKGNGKVYLAGVTSAGLGCAYPNSPDIYTRVPAYTRAIDDVISGESEQLKGDPVDDDTAILGDSGQQGGGGGGAFNSGWWIILVMLRRYRFKLTRLN